jgi:hypothetical protein
MQIVALVEKAEINRNQAIHASGSNDCLLSDESHVRGQELPANGGLDREDCEKYPDALQA